MVLIITPNTIKCIEVQSRERTPQSQTKIKLCNEAALTKLKLDFDSAFLAIYVVLFMLLYVLYPQTLKYPLHIKIHYRDPRPEDPDTLSWGCCAVTECLLLFSSQ